MRKKEHGRFVLGPVTLGLGALLSLLVFPPQAAAAAIYVLAFGDSASSIVGKTLGRIRPKFLSGKSIEGLMSCFAVSTLCAYLVFRDWKTALAVGFASLITDILPLGAFDNLLLPMAAGLAAALFRF
jgi:dolichol kinase